MAPALRKGDVIMADKRAFRRKTPQHEDIVVLKSPNSPGVVIVKRVIAEGGDTIMGLHNTVWLNGAVLSEPYVQHTGDAPDELMNFGPVTIPPHKLFVMGDNRDISLDSRATEFGLLDESAVVGKFIYAVKGPDDRKGKTPRMP